MTSARITDGDLEAVFRVFDVESKGCVNASDLLVALRTIGWSRAAPSDVEEIMRKLKKDPARGTINFAEFKTIVDEKRQKPHGAEEVHSAFSIFDCDKKGRVSSANLKAIGEMVTGRPVPEKLVAEIMRLADADRDGYLSFEEFRRAVTKYSAASSTSEEKTAASAAPAQAAPLQETSSTVKKVIAGVKVTFINGLISKTEVRDALKELNYDETALPHSVFEELFSDSDTNADGFLSEHEYCTLLVGFGENVDGY